MISDVVVSGIIAVASGGAGAAIVKGIFDRRQGIDQVAADREKTALGGFQELADDLREEIARLRSRLDRVEAEIAVERDLRWSAIQYARQLLAWIARHLPGEDPPDVPADLAAHITHPSRKDPPS